MPINKNEITKEMIEKAMQCKTADELIALAKAEGIELTKKKPSRIWLKWKILNWMTLCSKTWQAGSSWVVVAFVVRMLMNNGFSLFMMDLHIPVAMYSSGV